MDSQHNHLQPSSPQNKSSSVFKPFLIGCGIVIGVGIMAIVAFVIYVSFLPEGGVQLSNEIEEYALNDLKERNIPSETESLVAYYDATLSLNGSEAAVLTSERVIYIKDDRIAYIYIPDIADIKHDYDTFSGDIILITAKNGKMMKIEVAPANNGKAFLDALENVRAGY